MDQITGIEEIDYRVLVETPDRSLPGLCASSAYVNTLCQTEYHWLFRTSNRFGIVDKNIGGAPPDMVSWRELYRLLVENQDIADALGLSQEERFIQAVTAGGYAVEGSERYLPLYELFPRVIHERSPGDLSTPSDELFDYFFSLPQVGERELVSIVRSAAEMDRWDLADRALERG